MDEKPLVWIADVIKTPPLSDSARREAGFYLRQLQMGLNVGLPHSRPMPNIGARCHELRIVDTDHTWRIVYRIDDDAIVILEVFAKKTRSTPQAVVDTCRLRITAYDAD